MTRAAFLLAAFVSGFVLGGLHYATSFQSALAEAIAEKGLTK